MEATTIGALVTSIAAVFKRALEFLATGGSYRSRIARPATNLNVVFQITRELDSLKDDKVRLNQVEVDMVHEIIESSLVNLHFGEYLPKTERENFIGLSGKMPRAVAKIYASAPSGLAVARLFALGLVGFIGFIVLTGWVVGMLLARLRIPGGDIAEAAVWAGFVVAIVGLFFYSINALTTSLMAPFYFGVAKRQLSREPQKNV